VKKRNKTGSIYAINPKKIQLGVGNDIFSRNFRKTSAKLTNSQVSVSDSEKTNGQFKACSSILRFFNAKFYYVKKKVSDIEQQTHLNV